MDCRARPTPPAPDRLPLHQAVTAAARLAELDPPLALGLARHLTDGAYASLLAHDPRVANIVADATDLLDDALRALP